MSGTDTFQELLTEQLESASAPNLVQANLYIRQAEAVGLNDAIVGWLRNYRDQVVRIGQLEGELKLAKSAAREAWGEVRRCREIATPDLFEAQATERLPESEPPADEDGERGDIGLKIVNGGEVSQLELIEMATVGELMRAIELCRAKYEKDKSAGYVVPDKYRLVDDLADQIVKIDKVRDKFERAPEEIRGFVGLCRRHSEEDRHDAFQSCFADPRGGVEANECFTGSYLLDAFAHIVNNLSINDLSDLDVARIVAAAPDVEEGERLGVHRVPAKIAKLIEWAMKVHKQRADAEADTKAIYGVLEDLTAADGFPRPEDMCGFLADKWEELMPMARGTVTEMVFNRDSENEATVYREGNVFELSLFSPAGWATGKYRTRSLDEIAVILSTHEIWSAGPMRSRALGEKLLSSVTEGGLTGALSPESVESLWGMVHPTVYTTTKAGKRKLKKPRQKKAATR